MKHIVILGATVTILIGCEDLDDGTVSTRQQISGLTLINTTSSIIYYTVFNRASLLNINWAPCSEPSSCPSINAGSSTFVVYQDIWEYSPGSELVVYWWRLIPKSGGGYKPDEIRTVLVDANQTMAII
jgi:hypothetical protein